MTQIEITYRPLKWFGFTRHLKGSFPQSFAELSEKQLVAVAALNSDTKTDIGFMATMSGIKKRIVKKLDDFQRFNIAELFESFKQIAPHEKFIIGEIKAGEIILLSPKPKLKGITFGQFIFFDTLFADYHEDKNPDTLCKFIAALYSPAGKTFNEENIDKYSLLLKKADPAILAAIDINYMMIREWLAAAYPMVFIKDEPAEPGARNPKLGTRNPKPGTSSSSNGWIKVFESIVGDDLVNTDKYATLALHEVLRFLTRKIKENRKASPHPS